MFGCVMCGMPVFHYDHIDDYAVVRRHDATNLALLCPNHHQDKTSGRLSRERIKRAYDSPFNKGRSFTSCHRIYPGTALDARLGSNRFRLSGASPDFPLLWINGVSFATVHYAMGEFSFSAKITDEAGKVLLLIDHGEIVIATDLWDYRYEGTKLTVRRGQGDILFSGDISDSAFVVDRGHFVDVFETGVRIDADGTLVWTMSGLEVGSLSHGSCGQGPVAFAVIRGSCFPIDDAPSGGAVLRSWLPEYESRAEALRNQMESGIAGRYPRGLSTFRRLPL